MERSTKMVLVLALFLATLAVSLEGRDIKNKPNSYQPQTFPGANAGFFGNPGGLNPGAGGGSGLVPGFGLGQPLFGNMPLFGNVPPVPGLGLSGGGIGVGPGIGDQP